MPPSRGEQLEDTEVVPTSPQSPWSVGTLTYTKASLARLFAWLLCGDFALNLKDRAIVPIAQLMLRHFAAPVWLVGLLVGSIPSAIGLILGPIISVKSDRHRGPWGRRIPYILVPSPFIVAAMIGLAFTPEIGGALHHVVGSNAFSQASSRIAVFAVLWTGLEIATVIANSLVGALINDVVPQSVIGRFFGLFRIVSLFAGALFSFFLMKKVDAHYRPMLICLALAYGAGFILMCLKVKEGEYPPPPPRAPAHAGRLSPLISYLKECYRSPYYLCFFAATILGSLATTPVNTFQIYHARSVGMSDAVYGDCVALSYVISIFLSYPLGVLADKFHPLRMSILSMTLYAAATAFGFFYGVTSASFFVALLFHTVISGIFFTTSASIAQRLLPRNRFAEISSAGGIISGLCSMIMPPLLGVFIQLMNGNYRCVFLLASVLASLSALMFFVLYRWFLVLGGDSDYKAP